MLYVFYGVDIQTAGTKARSLIDSLRLKRPEAAYEKFEADSWNKPAIEGHLGGQGLFSSKYIVFLDRVTENVEAKDELPAFIPAMEGSENIFIVLEGKANAELKKAIEKHAEKAVECEPKATASKPKMDFNAFGIADALVRRDAFRAWNLYRQAIDSGTEPENIAGILFWKAKSISSKSLAKDLVTLYHDGHRGLVDLELGIEKLLLSC